MILGYCFGNIMTQNSWINVSLFIYMTSSHKKINVHYKETNANAPFGFSLLMNIGLLLFM